MKTKIFTIFFVGFKPIKKKRSVNILKLKFLLLFTEEFFFISQVGFN